MENGDVIRCTACDAVVTLGATSCDACGGTVSVPPEDPTRAIQLTGAQVAATPAGLPVRQPIRDDEDALRAAFARSWEPSDAPAAAPSWTGPRRAAAEPEPEVGTVAGGVSGLGATAEPDSRSQPVAPRVSRLNAFVQATASARAAEPFEPLDPAAPPDPPTPADAPAAIFDTASSHAADGPAGPAAAEPPTTLFRAAPAHEPLAYEVPAYEVPAPRVEFGTAVVSAAPEFSAITPVGVDEPLGWSPAPVPLAFIEPVREPAPANEPESAGGLESVPAPAAESSMPSVWYVPEPADATTPFQSAPAAEPAAEPVPFGAESFTAQPYGAEPFTAQPYGAAPAGTQPFGAEPEEPPQPAEPPQPSEPPRPVEPPEPAEPPKPVEPPKPAEPPEPAEPPRPPEPGPEPFPQPVPRPERPVPPDPGPLPDPRPPVPNPPLPTPPPSPVPSPPPPSPVPTPPPPLPTPPSPVPPPPSMPAPAWPASSVPASSLPAPSVPTPSVPTPSVTTPSVPTPSVPAPSVPTPSVPPPSVPALAEAAPEVTHAVVTQPISSSPVEAPTEAPNAATPTFGTPTVGGAAQQGGGSGVYRGGTYGQSDPEPVPGQRSGGTVYGGRYGLPTSANPEAPIEASGSLTGLILSRGQSGQIRPTEERSRLTKVLIVGLSALAFVSVIALIVATMAGDIISAVFRGLLG